MWNRNSEKWKDKARILCISLDDDKKSAKKKIDSNKWHKLTHLILEGWPTDNGLLKSFNI